jgi:hypothetical protein
MIFFGQKEWMIDFKCKDKYSNCKEGCINTNSRFYNAKNLKLRCIGEYVSYNSCAYNIMTLA